MKIRKANLTDLEELKHLVFGLIRYESRYDKRRKINMEKEVGKFGRRIKQDMKKKNYVCFVASEKGKIIGFSDGHNRDIFKMNKRAGYVRNVFVREAYRRKGIGKRLLGKVGNWMRKNKMSVAVLDVYPGNMRAIVVWRNLGFKPVKKHGKFLRMQKQLGTINYK